MLDAVQAIVSSIGTFMTTLYAGSSTVGGAAPVLGTIAMLPIVGGVVGLVVSVVRRGRG